MVFVPNMEGALNMSTVTHSFISLCIYLFCVTSLSKKIFFLLQISISPRLLFGSWSYLHPFSPEELHQVSAGGCFILCGCYLGRRPHYTMDLYVSSGEPHHSDMAAGGVYEHNRGLQQQGAGL